MTGLHVLGFDAFFARAFDSLSEARYVPARVVTDHGGLVKLAMDEGETLGGLSGRLQQQHVDVAVGDWVAVDPIPERAVIHAVLPRRSALWRSEAGRRTRRQVMAANVDTALLMMGLDGDYNPRRLDRYLLMTREGGIAPVVVLNKADVCDEAEARADDIRGRHPTVPVYRMSAADGHGLEALDAWLQPAQTVVALGSSGVGKSTLANRLLGHDRQRTTEVRATDSHGRHTTTHRELLALPGGALWIDTPGLREVQLWDGDGLDQTFTSIAAAAAACRFGDCQHAQEPGCAVLAAIDRGQLDPEALESWRKLGRELRYQASRQDEHVRLEARRQVRVLHRAMRQRFRSS